MTNTAFKIVETKRPVSEQHIGYRMVLAHENQARWNQRKGCYEQSFHPCYRITESGDYTKCPTRNQIERWLARQQSWFKIGTIKTF